MNGTDSLAGFAPGEAERAVQELRACLRRGETKAAQAHFERLLVRLAPHLEQRARAAFSRRTDLHEDGVREAVVMLWQRLTDLRELSSLLHWERRFHQALKNLLLDAFERTRNLAHDGKEVQVHEANDTEDSEGAPTALELLKDSTTHDALEAVLTNELLAQLPEKQVRAFLMYLEDYTRAEIASALGCAEKSVYNWVENVKSTLRTHYTQEL